MGFDCKYYFPKVVNKNKLSEIFEMLKYKKEEQNYFLHFNDVDYLSISGVSASIEKSKNSMIVHLHTQIACSKYDLEYLNKTARILREHFGGYFISDSGKNKYIAFKDDIREKAEAKCFTAYEYQFNNNLQFIKYYLDSRNFSENFKNYEEDKYSPFNILNPLILSNNLAIPFIVSVIEEYFKSIFIALLKYSPNKEAFLKNYRVSSQDLLRISEDATTIEEAVTKSMSFQNIKKICEQFSQLDKGLDFYSILKKPYGRRKESFYDMFDRIFEQRHNLIHSNKVNYEYKTEDLYRDLRLVEIAIKKIYKSIIKKYNWIEID